ncbi:MAG: phenylalanine--tRNA ligase subunit alpha [Planctomycetes bacterium]|nr:phenylalanine--tRNA ligase subunit alpha [Planctomycetota bacterium]
MSQSQGRPDVGALLSEFRDDLARANSPQELEEVRRNHTGKKSALKNALASLKSVSAEERPVVAREINEAKNAIESELESAKIRVESAAQSSQLDAEWQDLTMPGVAFPRGARHPLNLVESRITSVLRRLGFEVVDGPEVDNAYFNFDALNIPEHHPARDMQDTFWVEGGLLLRSHTTTVQARVLQARSREDLPIRVASLGRVYRNEAVDATHLAMFHQYEGIWVDRGLTFAHLKGTLSFIAHSLWGESGRIRFKPKFYPYTEPSVGVDVACTSCDGAGCDACHGAGWVTILGAGMVHPNVFAEFGFDPDEVSGIAFGLGTTRMAAQWAGVSKVRSLYEQDLRVHRTLYRGMPSAEGAPR